MFYLNTKEFLNTVCEQLKYKPARKPISEELENHIEDIKNDNLCKGYSEKEAEENAVEQMGDAKQIGKKLNKIHKPKLDWVILIFIAILLGFRIILAFKSWIECINLYGYPFRIADFLSTEYHLIKYLIIGIILGVIVYFFDYRKTKKWSNIIYFIATMLLIFQWINWYFNIDFEILKLPLGINMRLWNACIPLYIIAFAGYMADYKKEDFWDMIILYTISCVLIYAQSGSITNTTILILAYLAIVASKMLQNNIAIKKVATVLGGTICIAIVSMLLMTHIGTADAPEEVSYSNSSHFRFLYILGKLGIIPAVILAGTIIFMSIRLIKNSKNIKDVYGKYLIIGLGTTYIVQSVIHVLMNLNLWIRADVNLPFVAEGGLYFLINSFTFAVILSVYRRKNINFETVEINAKASE